MGDEEKEHADEKEEGTGIPGAIGAAAKVANSGPGRALLVPAAKVFGEYWGERATETVMRWKQKREENVRAHAEKVRKEYGSAVPREPTEKQFKLVNDWVESAQEIDPEDPEIAALWQGLLGAIYKKDPDTTEWLSILKQLDEGDAKLILNIDGRYVPDSGPDERRAEKLAHLGVLETFSLSRFLRREGSILALLFMLLISCGVFSFLMPLPFFFPDWDPDRTDAARRLAGIFFIICAFGVVTPIARHLAHGSGVYSLSEFGGRLQKSGHRYLEMLPAETNSKKKRTKATDSTG
jgi:hypothetical protein